MLYSVYRFYVQFEPGIPNLVLEILSCEQFRGSFEH